MLLLLSRKKEKKKKKKIKSVCDILPGSRSGEETIISSAPNLRTKGTLVPVAPKTGTTGIPDDRGVELGSERNSPARAAV